jgi:hypothetical protein
MLFRHEWHQCSRIAMCLSCRAQSRRHWDFSSSRSLSGLCRNDVRSLVVISNPCPELARELGSVRNLSFGISQSSFPSSYRNDLEPVFLFTFWLFGTNCTNVHELQCVCHVERSRDIIGISQSSFSSSYRNDLEPVFLFVFWLFGTNCTNVHELQCVCHVERSRDIIGISRRPDYHRDSVEMTLGALRSFRTDRRECEESIFFGFLNRRFLPHIEMTGRSEGNLFLPIFKPLYV